MVDENKTNNEKITSPDDPRLTAWLLGELDSNETPLIEEMLREHPEFQNEIDSLQSTIEQVQTALKNEPVLVTTELPSAGKANLNASGKKSSRWPRFTVEAALLVLMCVGIGVFFISYMQKVNSVSSPSVSVEPLAKEIFIDETAEIGVKSDAAAEKAVAKQEAVEQEELAATPEPAPANKPVTAFMLEPAETQSAPESALGESVAAPVPAPGLSGGFRSGNMMSPQNRGNFGGGQMFSGGPRGPFSEGGVIGRDTGAGRGFASVPSESKAKRRLEFDRDESRKQENQWKEEGYAPVQEKGFVTPEKEPLSTFSVDVDTASWSNIRRYLDHGVLPPSDAVRIEEMINYFKYNDAPPANDAKEPFATHVEVGACPWAKDHLLARIALKGKVIPKEKRPPLRLVFLIDVSGSMNSWNKLPLVQMGLSELVRELNEKDRVAIVVYAGSARVHLEPTSGSRTDVILRSIESLSAGGSTAGADGIQNAYQIAREQYDAKASNRVILCTDGDFNVGMTDNKELEELIAREAKSGVFLSVLGFGMGNYKDDRLSKLSNKGNGNYGYVDNITEAKKLLSDNLTGTLITIAKDVKIQVDFNPDRVAGYRLIGYEDRKLAAQDFNNDRKDAGEIGAGHSVSALYEIIPTGVAVPDPNQVDKSRYAAKAEKSKDEKPAKVAEKKPVSNDFQDELMFVKLRYKLPDGNKSTLITTPVVYRKGEKQTLSTDYDFAATVALFGQVLRNSSWIGDANLETVLKRTSDLSDSSPSDRKEFIDMVKKAKNSENQSVRYFR